MNISCFRMCRLFLNALIIGLVVGFSNALRIENISEQDNIVTEPVVDILEHAEDIPEYIEEDVEDVSEDNSVVSNPYQVPAGWSLMLYSLQAQLVSKHLKHYQLFFILFNIFQAIWNTFFRCVSTSINQKFPPSLPTSLPQEHLAQHGIP